MPSTNEDDVIAIKPKTEGIKYLTNVGKIPPVRASFSFTELIIIELKNWCVAFGVLLSILFQNTHFTDLSSFV